MVSVYHILRFFASCGIYTLWASVFLQKNSGICNVLSPRQPISRPKGRKSQKKRAIAPLFRRRAANVPCAPKDIARQKRPFSAAGRQTFNARQKILRGKNAPFPPQGGKRFMRAERYCAAKTPLLRRGAANVQCALKDIARQKRPFSAARRQTFHARRKILRGKNAPSPPRGGKRPGDTPGLFLGDDPVISSFWLPPSAAWLPAWPGILPLLLRS